MFDLMTLYRIANRCYRHHIPLLPKICQLLAFVFYNSKVTGDTEIGTGTYFVCKGISTVLIPGTRIGDNCVIGLRFSTVRKFPYKDVPCIKNNVWIGPNVTIAGPVIIEDNVIIAAHSFVNKSVPSGCIVAGSPAKVIGHTSDLEYDLFSNPKYKEGIAPYLENKK